MSKSCSRHFFYDDNCPACRAESLKEAIEEDREDRERLAEEQRRDHERRLEEEKEALEDHAWRVEAAAEKQRRDIARAPQLEAEELVKGAWDLYKVGLHEKAIAKAQRAIERDEGNIDAHVIASLALMRLGRHKEAEKYFAEQLALLAMPAYRDSPDRFFTVFSGLPLDEALVRDFCKVLHENSGRWLRHGPPYDLIRFLIDRKLLQDAKRLAQGFVGKRDSLRLHAFVLEIDLAFKTASSEGLEAYLRGIPFVKRDEVLREFTKVSTSNEFSEQTTSMLREAISRRYREWKPEIEKQIHESAVSEATRTTSGHSWVYGIAAYVALAGMVGPLLALSGGQTRLESETTTPIWAFGSLFGSILFGVWAGRITKQFHVTQRTQQQITLVEQAERNTWSRFGSTAVSVRRPGGLPTGLRILLLVAGMAAYLILWRSMLVASFEEPPPLQVGTVASCAKARGWRDYSPKNDFKPGDEGCVYAEALNVNRRRAIDVTFDFVILAPNHTRAITLTERAILRGESPACWVAKEYRLPPDSLPGTYTVEVNVRNNLSGQTARSSTTFQVLRAEPTQGLHTRLGVWVGNGRQDNGTTWPIRMRIDRDWDSASPSEVIGTIEYPSLQCGGSIIKTEQGLLESLSYGKDRCVDRGTIFMELDVDSKRVTWKWYYPDGRLGAEASLVRE